MLVLFFSINHFAVQLYLVTQYCQFVIKVTKYCQNVEIYALIQQICLKRYQPSCLGELEFPHPTQYIYIFPYTYHNNKKIGNNLYTSYACTKCQNKSKLCFFTEYKDLDLINYLQI